VLSGLAVLGFLGLVLLTAAGAGHLVDGVARRRLRRVAAQVRVTDAIHRTLGAVVAPTVTTAIGGRWIVTMGLGPRERAAAGRLSEIACEALGREGAGVEVVFTPRA
jgi:hypothetical protein